jgi:hypothetical protein
MTTITEDTTFDIDIACSLTAAEQAERGEEWAQLLADADQVTELVEGYALRFPNRDAWITRAVEVIIAERKCCPFFGFSLVFEQNGGPVWLHISGPGEVKAFIRDQVVPSRLRTAV